MGAIWGVPYLFIKVAVEHLAPPVVVFGRTSIAAVPLLVLAARAGAIGPALRALAAVLAFAALEMAGPVAVADRRRAAPAVGADRPADRVRADRRRGGGLPPRRPPALRPTRLAGIAVGLAGVTLLVAADLGGEAPWWSVAEVLLVCVGYATAPFIAARRLADVPDLGVVAVSLTAVAIVYAPFAWLPGPTSRRRPRRGRPCWRWRSCARPSPSSCSSG